jgi:hypothetical protein
MLSLSTHSFHFIYPPGLAHGPIRQGGQIRQRPSSGKLLTMGNFKKRLVSKFRPCGPNPAPEPPCNYRGPKPATKTHQVHAQPQPVPKEETATESRPRPPTLHPHTHTPTLHPPTAYPAPRGEKRPGPPNPPTLHPHPHACPAPPARLPGTHSPTRLPGTHSPTRLPGTHSPTRLPCTHPAVFFPGQYYHLRTKVRVSEWHRGRTVYGSFTYVISLPFSFVGSWRGVK